MARTLVGTPPITNAPMKPTQILVQRFIEGDSFLGELQFRMGQASRTGVLNPFEVRVLRLLDESTTTGWSHEDLLTELQQALDESQPHVTVRWFEGDVTQVADLRQSLRNSTNSRGRTITVEPEYAAAL